MWSTRLPANASTWKRLFSLRALTESEAPAARQPVAQRAHDARTALLRLCAK